MSSGKSKRFAVSRWTAALVLAGMLVPGFGLTAMAQSAGAESRNGLDDSWRDGLEGTWNAQLTVFDCDDSSKVIRSFPANFAYAKGGTFTVATAGQLPSLTTAGLGVWNHLHGRTYSAVSEAFLFSPAGALVAIQRLTRVITVSRDAKSYMDSVAVEILDTNKKVTATGCGSSAATRLE